MPIQSEFDRDVDVEEYIGAKTAAVKLIDRIISVLNLAVAFKTKYPDDTVEINQGIDWIKGRCQDIIDGY